MIFIGYLSHGLFILNSSDQQIYLKIGSDCVSVHQMTAQALPKKQYLEFHGLSKHPELCIITQFTQDNENKIIVTRTANIRSAFIEVAEEQGVISVEGYPS